jgi:hypothetical protein
MMRIRQKNKINRRITQTTLKNSKRKGNSKALKTPRRAPS